jgi:DNA-binding beta-propeller fold protein YncE
VERETTQRILEYDRVDDMLYLVKLGETDDEPGLLQIVDPAEKKITKRVTLGLSPTDLLFDENMIYVANFDSRTVSVITKGDSLASEMATGEGPLRMCRLGDRIFVINHVDRTVQELGGREKKMPFDGSPDNIFEWNGKLIISAHSDDEFRLISYDPDRRRFGTIMKYEYPYGDTSYDTNNVSFYLRGQYGDAVFDITKAEEGKDGNLRVIDFLSGKMFIVAAD